MKTRISICLILLIFLAIVISCDQDDSVGESPDYIPNEEGYSWTYEVEDNTLAEYTRTTAVNGTRDVGGTTCQIMETTNTNNSNISRTFFTDNEVNTVTIYGYENVVGGIPYPIYLDTPFAYYYPYVVGANFTLINEEGMKPTEFPFLFFEDDDIDNDGTDDSIDVFIQLTIEKQENVSVPAGTFENCFKIHSDGDLVFHLSLLGDYDVNMDVYSWFKPYIGRVKEETTVEFGIEGFDDFSSTAELLEYDITS